MIFVAHDGLVFSIESVKSNAVFRGDYMNSVNIFGIKNCDTMKKAFKWLEENNIPYEFHDYKKSGVPDDIIRKAIDALGWEKVINMRGTTWRTLPEDVRKSMDAEQALQIALQFPSVVKRPLFIANNSYYVGFTAEVREKNLI